MQASTDDDALRQRASELYWSSDTSVNHIAEELDLSKGTLYSMIEPLESGLACPSCSAEMEYPNRTARDQGFLTCAACGYEEDEDVVRRQPELALVPDGPASGARRPRPGTDRDLGRLGVSRKLLGTALIGAAAGIALAFWARRR